MEKDNSACSMLQIVARCLRIDTAAQTTYDKLAAAAHDTELASFWRRMALEEQNHRLFWQQLISDHEQKPLPNVFDDPDRVLAELDQNAVEAEKIAAEDLSDLQVHTAFLKAFKMEFYLLHPAFEVMFRLLGGQGSWSPESEYDEHIGQFISELRKHGSTPEMELVSQLLDRLWRDHRHLATKYDRIQELKGLLPICSSCKKVRDDGGYWRQIEEYFSVHAGAEFTHGICPGCVQGLYSEPRNETNE